MPLEKIVQVQYQAIVERARERSKGFVVPKEGWIRTVRKALNMSGAQLANRLSLSRASVSNAEKAELEGGVTIKKMEQMALGLGCRFVYFVVPEKPIEDVLSEHAQKKAEVIVSLASQQMALEAQTLSNEQLRFEVDRLKKELLKEMPSDFWGSSKS